MESRAEILDLARSSNLLIRNIPLAAPQKGSEVAFAEVRRRQSRIDYVSAKPVSGLLGRVVLVSYPRVVRTIEICSNFMQYEVGRLVLQAFDGTSQGRFAPSALGAKILRELLTV